MKRNLFILILAAFPILAFSQAKKPTIMVVPSDAWCNQHGYVQTFDNMGTEVSVSDYNKAFANSMDLKLVISKIGELMADRGFPLKDLEATLKNIAIEQAEESLITSKQGSTIAENPIDRIRRTAKADIIIEIGWEIAVIGPKSTLTYVMRGLDSYTNKQIAGSSGATEPTLSAAPVVLLEEAVLSKIDAFNMSLQSHFDDMFDNGREVALDIRVFDNASGIDLETEFDDEELSEIIDNWMSENTVKGRYSRMSSSETRISFEQVRIPLYKENGSAMDTEAFARVLRKFLRKEPYNLQVKVMSNGLGKCMLIIGEK